MRGRVWRKEECGERESVVVGRKVWWVEKCVAKESVVRRRVKGEYGKIESKEKGILVKRTGWR